MTPRTRKFNDDIKRKLNKINKSQAVFLSKARKLDQLTGESFSASIEHAFKKVQSVKMFNPADYEVIENLRTRENKNFERITRQSKKTFQQLQLKYPGFFESKPDKEAKEVHPVPNMTHPENDPIFLEKPQSEPEHSPAPKPRVRRREPKAGGLMALAESVKNVPYKFYLRGSGNCNEKDLHA